jgi:5-methyltetrahydropteroyltriglutamate--homocysteine methyltransferase
VLARLGGKQIMVGAIDLSDMTVESPATVAERVRRAVKYVSPENVIIAPDCGMKYLPREVAFGKMRAMAEAAKILRKEYGE